MWGDFIAVCSRFCETVFLYWKRVLRLADQFSKRLLEDGVFGPCAVRVLVVELPAAQFGRRRRFRFGILEDGGLQRHCGGPIEILRE